MIKNILALKKISDLVKDRDFAELSRRETQQRIAKDARSDFVERAKDENRDMENSLSYRKDQEFARRLWRDRQQYALGHHEARAAALVEAQKPVVAKSFGRAMVLEQLCNRMKMRSLKKRI